MEREQFTFYRSFWEAMKTLPKKDQLPFVTAVCAYAFGEDFPTPTGPAGASFLLVRPILDTARKKAENGKRGGSKPKANRKQSVSEKEGEKEKEVEGEIENECYPPTPLPPPEKANAVSAVLADYLDRINPTASPASLDELKGYAEEMGEAVCKRAFDIALDSKKTTWPYIRAILRDKLQRGVRCIADWDALEKESPEKDRSSGSNGGGTRKSWSELAAEMEANGEL